jgi:hypothetical protein
MHKALTQMNVQIQYFISDVTGLTGLTILEAIVAGERDPAVLARLRDPRIKASEETIRKSLESNWRARACAGTETTSVAVPQLSGKDQRMRQGDRETGGSL